MLKYLIVSKVRVKILELLLTNPNEVFHVREITRRTNEEINAVRRELSHLEDSGFLTSERRANRLVYFFRSDNILYQDLLSMVYKTSGLGGKIVKNKSKLGKIKFIETAIARTQDPHDLKNYIKQITRWNRGNLQLFVRNKMWRKVTRVNSFITYQVLQNMLFATMYGVALPILSLLTGSLYFIAVTFVIDVLTIIGFALYTAMRTKRFETLTSFPLTYFLRWVQLVVFVKCFFEVVVLRRYRISHGSWETVARIEQRT